jgi:hypothetical protein
VDCRLRSPLNYFPKRSPPTKTQRSTDSLCSTLRFVRLLVVNTALAVAANGRLPKRNSPEHHSNFDSHYIYPRSQHPEVKERSPLTSAALKPTSNFGNPNPTRHQEIHVTSTQQTKPRNPTKSDRRGIRRYRSISQTLGKQ